MAEWGGSDRYKLKNVSVNFANQAALNKVNLQFGSGEKVALVGPSGAGKTTLLRLFNSAVEPTAGQVVINDTSIADMSGKSLKKVRSRVGFVHQDLRLVPNLRVSQNVLSGRLGQSSWWQSAKMFLKPSAAELSAVHTLLEKLGISELIFQRVDRLSGGEAQRVAIARALYQDPSLLAADEPVASVDPERAAALLTLMTEICTEKKLTLLVSLHNPDLARRFFTRIVGLRDGRIEFDAPATEVTDVALQKLYELRPDRER